MCTNYTFKWYSLCKCTDVMSTYQNEKWSYRAEGLSRRPYCRLHLLEKYYLYFANIELCWLVFIILYARGCWNEILVLRQRLHFMNKSTPANRRWIVWDTLLLIPCTQYTELKSKYFISKQNITKPKTCYTSWSIAFPFNRTVNTSSRESCDLIG